MRIIHRSECLLQRRPHGLTHFLIGFGVVGWTLVRAGGAEKYENSERTT